MFLKLSDGGFFADVFLFVYGNDPEEAVKVPVLHLGTEEKY